MATGSHAPDASGGWVSLPNPDSGTTHGELGVACPGATTCYVVGQALWRTTDGGKTVFDTGGQAVKTVSLTPRTLSDGTPYFMWVGALTQPGSYTAAITVRVGSATTHTSLSFTVR